MDSNGHLRVCDKKRWKELCQKEIKYILEMVFITAKLKSSELPTIYVFLDSKVGIHLHLEAYKWTSKLMLGT